MRRRQFLAGALLSALFGGPALAADDWRRQMPRAVAAKRLNLLRVASRGSLEELSAMADGRFVFTKGLAEERLAYWRSLLANDVDVRKILITLLEQEPGHSPQGSFVWPTAGLEGDYPDWRTSIAADGRWEWLVYDD